MRAIEYSLGVPNSSFTGLISDNTGTPMNVTAAIEMTARSSSLTSEIQQVLRDAISIIAEVSLGLKVNLDFEQDDLRARLASGSPLVAKYGLNSEFVSARRVVHDDFTALWMSAGSTIIPLTQLMQPWDRRHTIIIYITRKFEFLFYSGYLVTSCYLDLGCVFANSFQTHLIYDNISRALPMIMKKLTWLVFAVSPLPLLSFCSLFDPSHLLDLNRIQADAALGNSPLWFGGTSIRLFFSFRSTNLTIF